MKNFFIKVIVLIVAGMMFFPVGITSAADQKEKKYKFRLQCAYHESAFVGQTSKFFVQRVKELTNGNVDIKIFWPDQLVKTNETFEAVRKGMLDFYIGSILYFSGYVPEVNCEWIPFGWTDPKEPLELFRDHGWLDLMREALDKHNVRYVAPLAVASMGLITKFPVHNVSDLKGRSIRAVGMEGKIIDVLGGSPVSLTGAEQYMALHRGTVDGTDFPFYTIGSYRFYEVCNYIIRPALHAPGLIEILTSRRAYEKLPEKYQAAIDQAGWETFERSVQLNPSWDEEAYAMCDEKGVEIIDLTPEALNEFRKATIPLWNELAEKSDVSRKLVESLKAYLSNKGIEVE
ncbi:TRAP transporter substrate-binding protein DctP [Desulfosarcina sp. OttesenSCG-928-A07]|nr:TRAP transporter substrate-binding protein DctP [Desulfosarcina sp. OttesenSCG-928-A07]